MDERDFQKMVPKNEVTQKNELEIAMLLSALKKRKV